MALPTRIAPAPGDTTTPHASWLMRAVLLLGQFMCIIDVLVTNAPGSGSGSSHAAASAAATSAAAMSGTACWLAALSAAGLLAAAIMVRAAQGRRSPEP